MRIQIDGTGMENKGAELMLYSIIGELEKRFPNATVYYNTIEGSIKNIKTPLDLRHRFFLRHGKYPKKVLRRLHMDDSYFDRFYVNPSLDLILDGSGFRWGDQWTYNDSYFKKWDKYYRGLKKNGTKIILLPQAFGPFELPHGKTSVSLLNSYADMVFAREETSYNYLLDAGMDPKKTFICTDFSGSVSPKITKDIITDKGVCIIPNSQMIKHGGVSREQYLQVLKNLIGKVRELGYQPFLLNHEGEGDLEICRQVNAKLEQPVEVVSDLDARQTKGVIAQSYAVISSRFHGVASALNQGVPCLATSWSHKYAELFRDFGLDNGILDVTGSGESLSQKLEDFLQLQRNEQLRLHLQDRKQEIATQVNAMWDRVFEGMSPS